MTKVTLDDLKFIEDKKNRRAFLIALREVEAEGFDLAEANAAAKKIHEIETTPVEVNESKREGIDLKTVGATPAERAAASSFKRSFTNTNAVDMKDYKYWRDPDFDKSKNLNNRQRSSNPFASRNMFEDSIESSMSHSMMPEKKKSLYDELFGDAKDHEVTSKAKPTSKLFKELESLADEPQEDTIDKPQTVSNQTKENKFLSDEYKQKAKVRAEAFKKKLEDEEREKEAKRLEDEAKRLEEERKALQAKRVELEAREAEAAANEKRLEESKLVVEVVAPENASQTKKKSSSGATKVNTPKTRKRKKKYDADIKLYRNIHID